jgi:hypothetical protein
VEFDALKHSGDRKALMGELFDLVHGLAPARRTSLPT